MRRRHTTVLSLSVSLILLAGCGGGSSADDTTTTTEETTTTTTVAPILSLFNETVAGLSVGDCYNNGKPVTQIECEELHDGQVISTSIYLDSSLASTTQSSLWIADAEDKCELAFKEFVGYDYDKEKGRFAISLLLEDYTIPSVSCTVVDLDGEKWAGTAKNFVGSYAGVSVGDCFMFPTATNDAVVVSCSQPHEAEMFVVNRRMTITKRDAPYPTKSEWGDIGYDVCEKPFLAYTGVSEDDKTLSYSYIFPLEEDWLDLDRRLISCAATSYSGVQLTYSVRKS